MGSGFRGELEVFSALMAWMVVIQRLHLVCGLLVYACGV